MKFASLHTLMSPPEAVREPQRPEDITLATTPWISGTRAVGYYGAARSEIEVPLWFENWHLRTIVTTLRRIQQVSFEAGGNYVVGVETFLNWDPDFVRPWVGRTAKVYSVGTAAKLENLWGRSE